MKPHPPVTANEAFWMGTAGMGPWTLPKNELTPPLEVAVLHEHSGDHETAGDEVARGPPSDPDQCRRGQDREGGARVFDLFQILEEAEGQAAQKDQGEERAGVGLDRGRGRVAPAPDADQAGEGEQRETVAREEEDARESGEKRSRVAAG